jgi:hypothetical protein
MRRACYSAGYARLARARTVRRTAHGTLDRPNFPRGKGWTDAQVQRLVARIDGVI